MPTANVVITYSTADGQTVNTLKDRYNATTGESLTGKEFVGKLLETHLKDLLWAHSQQIRKTADVAAAAAERARLDSETSVVVT